MNIYSTIRQEWTDYMYNNVEIVDGYTFNQYDTIKRIHRYYNSKFENANKYNNRDKLFFNISKYRCTVASRMLNFDTKDIRLWPLNPESEVATFLLEKELAFWMKKNKVGKILNQIAEEAPIYGSVILRKTKKGAKVVDLRRIAMDPTVETIQDSRFISLKHYLTEPELRQKKADGWDSNNVDILIERKGNTKAPPAYESNSGANQVISSPYYEIYERFGEVEKSLITGKSKDTEMVRSLFIVAEPFSVSKSANGGIESDNGLILFKSEWKGEYPFKDYHYSKVKGRYLGVGVIEDLFPAQERRNEMANQKRVSMEISGMHLFQTQGKTTLSNILSDLQNGDVLSTGLNGTISSIPTEERNLPAFSEEQKEYDALADRLSFSYDAVRGEALPASTPVTNAIMQNQNAQSIFAFKRENLGLMLQEFFNEIVLPQLVKDLSHEHILRFMGGVEDIDKLDRIVVKSVVRDEILKNLLNGKVVTNDTVEKLEESARNQLKQRGATRFLEVTDDFYKDTEFEFDFMVTNEQENIAGMATNLFQLITSLSQNPGLLENPVIKTLLYEYAQKIGISPIKLEMAENQKTEQENSTSQMGPMPQVTSQNMPQGMPDMQQAMAQMTVK